MASRPVKRPSRGKLDSVTAYVDVALPVPLDRVFTYALPAGVEAPEGSRVLAPWGPRRLAGVVVGQRAELPAGVTAAQVKTLVAVLDDGAWLDAPRLELVRWTAAYYQAPIGEVMRCALPPGKPGAATPVHRSFALVDDAPAGRRESAAQRQALEILRRAGGEADAAWLRSRASASALATLVRQKRLEIRERPAPLTPPAFEPRARVEALNPNQRAALAAIDGEGDRPLLLHGVTGSGKTAVYLAAIEKALQRGQGALLLVPEIGLTPALFADFEHAFPGLIAMLHSSLSDGERGQHWRRLQRGEARIAIGTRSAVFAPVRALGLIVVDEEHDASYKQQESPRYHARDLAVLRGKLAGARVVLGSATPSLETYQHARDGKYGLVEMAERVESRPLPAIQVVDMGAAFRRRAAGGAPARNKRPDEEAIFSAELAAALRQRLERGQQALLLINRRGFAPVVLCRACGASVMCRDCALALTFHRRAERLVCHFCGYGTEVPRVCPGCGSEHLYFLGAGSEKVEEALAALLPGARIARLDRDTARTRRDFEQTLRRFAAREFDILVGTQMIAKGHDLAGVTLVGILQADLGLTFPDFRAAERTFQLLTQVAGRAGRGREPGEVIMQVQHPEHYAVETAARADFAGFVEKEANFRRWMHYPPFAALALAQLRHTSYDRVLQLAAEAGEHLRLAAARHPRTKILGPSPALLARAKNEYRFQFLFKSGSRRELSGLLRGLRDFAAARKFPATALIVDVDPLNL